MTNKYQLNEDVYYADLANVKIRKAKVVGIQFAVNMHNPLYQLDVGLALSQEDLHSSFEDAKLQIVELTEKFKEIKNENN